LVCPAGLEVPGYPLTDFSVIPPQDIHKYLIEDVSIIAHHIPANADEQWHAERNREGAGFGRLLQSGLIETEQTGPSFSRWLHRVNMPSLLIWGEKDRTTPIQQSAAWLKAIPGIKLHRVPNAGHLVLDENPQGVQVVADFLG
jgi:pimeloyl-ACP methyl ester carboxylesterase